MVPQMFEEKYGIANRLDRPGRGKTELTVTARSMHEFALAEAVVRSALDVAEKEGISRVTKLVVQIGELQTIEREVFRFALGEIIPAGDPKLSAMEIELETTPARFRCRPCEREFDLAECGGPKDETESEAIHFVPELAHAYLRCPQCQSPDFAILEGRGVILATVEGEE